MSRQQEGFTLLEILVVLAILGIVFGLVLSSMLGFIRSNQLRDAATQVQGDLEQARSSTLRYNRPAQFRVTSASTYELLINGQRSSRTVPNAVTLAPLNTTVDYTAPYSVMSSASQSIVLTLGSKTRRVRTVGVTGKAVVDAS
ncbi:pilus assembly FimT family protein [Deinococcus hohokamensis]|uniref:Tfp pilus assembly protein FimT/FimU n=1 Tax=Deinococcus hohokamensis TaxID=309883 RepID=A0ABV9I877_9DEIO